MSDTSTIKGGEFIIRDTKPEQIFIPEEWTEEQIMIAKMCDDFIAAEVDPNLDRIDEMEDGLMQSILEKAGELGLLSLSVRKTLGEWRLILKQHFLRLRD